MNRGCFYNLSGYSAVLISLLGLSACFTVSDNSDTSPVSAAQVLHDVSSIVIVPTYEDLAAKAGSLQAAINLLIRSPDSANLAAAQQAWRAARVPWEQSEAFLFGPVETYQTDPAVDSWPLNVDDLDIVLNSGVLLTKGYVDSLNFNLKGFHTVEYLLFGDTGNADAIVRYPANLTTRQLEYLQAVTASLVGETQQLLQAWDPAGGNYLGAFQNAGPGDSIYTSSNQALQQLLDYMVNICDEVANGKMFDPFKFETAGVPDRDYEESRFSNNSIEDFADNIRSVRNLYLGSFDGVSGNGLKALVAQANPALAGTVETQIDSAISAVLAMGIFGTVMFDPPAPGSLLPVKVQTATEAILTLRSTLITSVAQALNLTGL